MTLLDNRPTATERSQQEALSRRHVSAEAAGGSLELGSLFSRWQ